MSVVLALSLTCPVLAAQTESELDRAGKYLKEQGIYYFDVIHPQETPEPGGPEKADVLQNG